MIRVNAETLFWVYYFIAGTICMASEALIAAISKLSFCNLAQSCRTCDSHFDVH
jgi:hypothetical protein